MLVIAVGSRVVPDLLVMFWALWTEATLRSAVRAPHEKSLLFVRNGCLLWALQAAAANFTVCSDLLPEIGCILAGTAIREASKGGLACPIARNSEN